jgi:uncharacterized protein (TIGR00661 family)
MKILYGVAGQGYGHSSRSELIGQYLINAGHNVTFGASHQSLSYLSCVFGDRVKQLHGLSLSYRNQKICYFKTLQQNIQSFLEGGGPLNRKFFKCADQFKPDIVITDFEPFVARWAQKREIPCISIDHQHFLIHCELERPKANYFEQGLTNTVIRSYQIHADAYIILNFFKVAVKHKRAKLAPPVIRFPLLDMKTIQGKHYLIYTTDKSAEMKKRIINLVQIHNKCCFVIYGFNVNLQGINYVFKKTTTGEFLNDLSSCRGVIATAGFSLISECLYFKKPMLLMPVKNQYEQSINAHYVQKSNAGLQTQLLTSESFEAFKSGLASFTADHPEIIFPNNQEYFTILDQLLKSY